MPGNGDPASGSIAITIGGTNLPSLLASLEADDVSVTREAVETVRETVADDPMACLPTVPKLRELLERDALDFRDSVAYCLAELASQSPEDVAPSVDAIARFARTEATAEGQGHALRCLAHVATARPGAVETHLETVLSVLEESYEADEKVLKWGLASLSELATNDREGLEAARPALEAALEDDRPRVRQDACLVIGHGRLSTMIDRLEAVAADEPNPEVRNRAVWAIGKARSGH